MTTPHGGSLRRRLLTGVVGGVAIVWSGAAAWTVLDARHELSELLDAHLAQAAGLLVAPALHRPDDDAHDHAHHEAHEDTHDGGSDADEGGAPLLHRYAPRAVFQVWHRGRLVSRSANAPLEPLSIQPTGFTTARIDGRDWRVFAAPGPQPDMLVFVGETLEARDEILGAVMRGSLLPLAAALPLLALAVGWAVWAGLGPLGGLGRALRERSPESLEPLETAGAPAEIVPLVDALNALFARIAAAIAGERRFTADAAHELRTPIAAIRTQAQVARGARDDAERDRALAAVMLGCDRAAHLVEQLLLLARVDASARTAPAGPVSFDIAAVLRDVAGQLAPRCLERGQSLDVLAEAPLSVWGDPALAAVVIRNLLDNASRYAGPGRPVQASVRPAAAGGVLLRVEDGGAGLNEAAIARLGERFFRVLGTGEEGSGLGWSIVRRIAEVDGLDVAVSRSDLGGLAVEVRWHAP